METVKTTLKAPTAEARPGCRRQLLAVRLKEYVNFDSFVCRKVIAWLGLLAWPALNLCGRTKQAFRILSAIHRTAYSKWVSKVVERWVRARVKADQGVAGALGPICDEYLADLPAVGAAAGSMTTRPSSWGRASWF